MTVTQSELERLKRDMALTAREGRLIDDLEQERALLKALVETADKNHVYYYAADGEIAGCYRCTPMTAAKAHLREARVLE